MGDVNINRRDIDRLFSDPDGPVARELLKVALKVERSAKRLCPVDHGRLRASISGSKIAKTDERGLYVTVGSDVEYALYVEMGTGLYGTGPKAKKQRITPKTGKALRFKVGGKTVFATSVAGQHPQPYLRPALKEHGLKVTSI